MPFGANVTALALLSVGTIESDTRLLLIVLSVLPVRNVMYTVLVSRFRGTRFPRHVTMTTDIADSTAYADLVVRIARMGDAKDVEFYVYSYCNELADAARLQRECRLLHFGVLCHLNHVFQYYSIRGSCWKYLARRLIRLGVSYQHK